MTSRMERQHRMADALRKFQSLDGRNHRAKMKLMKKLQDRTKIAEEFFVRDISLDAFKRYPPQEWADRWRGRGMTTDWIKDRARQLGVKLRSFK